MLARDEARPDQATVNEQPARNSHTTNIGVDVFAACVCTREPISDKGGSDLVLTGLRCSRSASESKSATAPMCCA